MNDKPKPNRTPTRAAVFEALLGFFSLACILGGAAAGLGWGNWPAAIFLALVAVWIEVGD